MQPSSPRDRSFGAALLAITVAAAALRLWRLDEQILGDDELHLLVVVTGRTLREIPGTVIGYDYGIPLALLDRAWSALAPLTEWALRAPMLLCGIATPALAALLARRFASRSVALLLALAVAVHPLCVFYSRTVRPYGVCLALVLGVLLALQRWQRTRRRGALGWAIALSALACWCQPLAGITVALAWLAAWLVELAPGGRARAAAGAASLALLATLLLYAPALEEVYRRVVLAKTGVGTLDAHVLARDAAVLSGMPGLLPALLLGACVAAGAVRLARLAGRRALLLLLPAAGQPLVILLLAPEGMEASLVLARYQFYVLPVFLLCACLALAALAAAAGDLLARAGVLPSRAAGARTGLLIAVLLAACWVAFGPWADIYARRNAYTHHDLFQTLAYRDDPAWRAARARGPDAPVHPFYAQLAGPDVPLVLEWPPPMDYPRNELPFAQAVHDHPMKLLVRPPESPTPEPWWSDARLALRNVVVARPDVLARLPRGTAIVVHRNPSVEAGHFRAHIDGWLPPAPAHARACAEVLATLAAACGPPLLEDRYLVVFRVPGQ